MENKRKREGKFLQVILENESSPIMDIEKSDKNPQRNNKG